jgi:hypothetical protein
MNLFRTMWNFSSRRQSSTSCRSGVFVRTTSSTLLVNVRYNQVFKLVYYHPVNPPKVNSPWTIHPEREERLAAYRVGDIILTCFEVCVDRWFPNWLRKWFRSAGTLNMPKRWIVPRCLYHSGRPVGLWRTDLVLYPARFLNNCPKCFYSHCENH